MRIGYVSANFRTHAEAFLISALIEQHDRQAFEIIGYSAGSDDVGEAIAAAARRAQSSCSAGLDSIASSKKT